MTRPLTILVPLLLAFVAGCATPEPAPTDTGGTVTTSPAAPTVVEKTVTVGGGVCPPNPPPVPTLYSISPSKLELALNVPVNLTLKNVGCAAHDLTIKGIDGATIKSVEGGKSASVTFTPTKAGTYEMICTLAGGTPASHADNGMKGTVVVA